jgi:hypothetical protein
MLWWFLHRQVNFIRLEVVPANPQLTIYLDNANGLAEIYLNVLSDSLKQKYFNNCYKEYFRRRSTKSTLWQVIFSDNLNQLLQKILANSDWKSKNQRFLLYHNFLNGWESIFNQQYGGSKAFDSESQHIFDDCSYKLVFFWILKRVRGRRYFTSFLWGFR